MNDAGMRAHAKHVRHLGHLDLPGGGQVVVQGDYAYVGHLSPPYGTSIIDISNPRQPRVVSQIMLDDPYTHTHKVRVVGDLMYTNWEQDNRYYFRKGALLDQSAKTLGKELGRAPTNPELLTYMSQNLYTEGKKHTLKESDIVALREAQKRGYPDGGFRIYDISDKSAPKLIKHQRTFGWGVHRFYVDEKYAYVSTEWEGYLGNVLVIYDVSNPANPQYVSHWGLPGQHIAGGEKPHWVEDNWRVHHGLRQGNTLWVSALWGGIYAVDVTDIRNPRTLAHHNYHPPFPEPTHTVLPLPFELDGRKIAVVADETQIHRKGQPHGMLWIMDITDLADIKPLSVFTVSQRDSPWALPGVWFGSHQFQEHFKEPIVYSAWFSGGLRIIDINDPTRPREVGYFVPPPGAGQKIVGTNDVDVGENGLIYLMDRYNGLDVVEFDRRGLHADDDEGAHGHGCC